MTIFHYIEQMEGCNYRHPKAFSGTIKVGKKSHEDTFIMAVRNEGIATNVDPMGEIMEKNGIVQKTMIGQSEIKLVSAKDVFRITTREMKKNPKLLYSETK
jgi:aminoglycoside N3'-acetyltransferase